MNGVTNIGVAGLKAAEARVAIRAQNVVQALVPNPQMFTPVQTTRAAAPVVRALPITDAVHGGPFANVAEDLVDMRGAVHAYRASAAIVRTAQDMSRSLLDALA